MSKILVAYFSASGQTRKLAQTLASAAGGDLFEIRPVTPYTSKDLNWMDKGSRSTLEMQDKSSRPPMAEPVPGLEQYDTVFVGFPIWWYEAPRIIATFLESGDFSGKTVIPFATSGSSGIERADSILPSYTSPETKWLPGRRMEAGASRKEVQDWVSSLKI